MSSYEIIALIISGFTAIGTCGATILALYFWFYQESLRLKFHAMYAASFGSIENIDGGYLFLKFTNTGYKPISLEMAGIRFICGFFSKTSTVVELGMQNNNNLINDRLPKILQHGEAYTFVTSWNDFLNLFKGENFNNIKVYACVSSLNKEIEFNFNNYVFKKIKNDIKN